VVVRDKVYILGARSGQLWLVFRDIGTWYMVNINSLCKLCVPVDRRLYKYSFEKWIPILYNYITGCCGPCIVCLELVSQTSTSIM
jgi:hypothetical protein